MTMSDSALLARRRLHWPACYNVRDLGSLPIANGSQTRRGGIVRSDCLGGLTEAGWQALVAHGVRTIIDLRAAEERQRDGYALHALAVSAGVCYRGVTMRPLDPALQALLLEHDLAEGYVLMVDLLAPHIAEVLRAIATAQPGGIAIHCSAGRDRTAIITALLLALAGVPAEVIAADYIASQAELWPRWEARVAAAGGDEEAAGLHLRPLLDAETMLYLLRHIDERYGGAAGYMAAVGLTQEERAALADRLVEDRP
ncbi:MAG: tyrosine-protein phosphatase [Anaerolineae bacterium]